MTYLPVMPGSTAYPDIQLEWAPTTKPTDTAQTYVDITSRLRGWAWQYGRNDELSEFEPGRGYVILDNRDRALDPSNTAGAWYGNIKPRKMFRMQYRYNGVTYPGFIAYARGFPQSWPGYGVDNLVRVDLVDGLAILQGIDLISGFTRSAELSSDRISAVLDAISIPAGLRDIDTGTVTSAAITVDETGTSGLGHCKTVAADENGQLFTAKDGKLTFHNRTRRLNKTSMWTFTDNPAGNLRYSTSFEPDWDDTYLWNYVYVTGPEVDDTPGIASDSTSMLDYHTLARTFSSQLATEPDRTALAQYQVILYKQPSLRAAAIQFTGATNPVSLWPMLLDLEVSDRVTITRFATAAVPMTVVQNIEGIGHVCQPGGPWVTTVSTSPADQTAYWVLEDATYGAIDGTNKVAP